MNSGHSKVAITGAFVAAWLALASSSRAESPWQAQRVWVTGGDSSAWVVAEGKSQGDQLPTIQMWYAGTQAEKLITPTQNSFLLPVSGRIQHAAADVAALRLMFSDQTTGDYFVDRAWSPGASWKIQSSNVPLAWGADASEPAVYAVARAADLIPPTSQAVDDDDDKSVNADDLDEPSVAATAPPPEGVVILEHRRGRWRRMAGPIEAALAQQVWICGFGGRVQLYWRLGTRVRFADRSGNQWSAPVDVLSCDDLIHAWAGASADGPGLIVARGEADLPCNLYLCLYQDGRWNDQGEIRAGGDALTVDVKRCSAAIVRKQLAVARIGQDGSIEYGLGELSQSPLVRFNKLELRSSSPAMEQQWRDSIVMAVLLAFLTIVMWMRRTEIARPVVLPPGFVLSAVWRRVFATVFDLLPAYLATMPWWYFKLDPQLLQMMPRLTNEQMLEMWAAVRVEQYITIALYGLWCLVFEATIATTPGKLIFGCRVASADGARPRLGQCIVRNAVRSMMVAMGTPGLMITLMTIVIVSRNRQRVGDLLARTVVIEPAPPAAQSPKPPEEADFE